MFLNENGANSDSFGKEEHWETKYSLNVSAFLSIINFIVLKQGWYRRHFLFS